MTYHAEERMRNLDLTLILKISGVGIIVSIASQILSKTGKDDVSSFISVAGIITVMLLLLGEMRELLSTVKEIFGL